MQAEHLEARTLKPPQFVYYRPSALTEALELLAELGPRAKVLAGGQSLVPVLNMRLASPEALIDLKHVPELAFIQVRAGAVAIGAMTLQRAVERSESVRGHAPLLHEAVGQIGHVQIRNRGTVGGSIAHAYPAAELPAVAVALGATMLVQSAAGGREVKAGEFFTGYLGTVLATEELLTEIRFPIAPVGTGAAFVEVSRRQGDFAICGVAAQLLLDADHCLTRLHLALTGVGPVPVAPELADLLGEQVTAATLTEIGRRSAAAADPYSDLHATADYRRHLAAVLSREAVVIAAERALGERSAAEGMEP